MAQIIVFYNTNSMALINGFNPVADVLTEVSNLKNVWDTVANTEEARTNTLGELFRLYNDDEELPEGVTRSMSVGDVVVFILNQGKDAYAYACDRFGWKSLKVIVINGRVYVLSPYDPKTSKTRRSRR